MADRDIAQEFDKAFEQVESGKLGNAFIAHTPREADICPCCTFSLPAEYAIKGFCVKTSVSRKEKDNPRLVHEVYQDSDDTLNLD